MTVLMVSNSADYEAIKKYAGPEITVVSGNFMPWNGDIRYMDNATRTAIALVKRAYPGEQIVIAAPEGAIDQSVLTRDMISSCMDERNYKNHDSGLHHIPVIGYGRIRGHTIDKMNEVWSSEQPVRLYGQVGLERHHPSKGTTFIVPVVGETEKPLSDIVEDALKVMQDRNGFFGSIMWETQRVLRDLGVNI